MATKTKSTKEIVLIARFVFKNSNRVIYKVRSNQANKKGRIEGRDQVERNGLYYDCYEVSCNEEYVYGCQGSGEPCPGRHFKGTCSHSQFIEKVIVARRQNVCSSAQPVNDLSGKIVQFKKDWAKPERQKEDWTEKASLANSRAFKII